MMISSLIVLLGLSIFSLFISYQAFRYRRLYWVWPTITGFKRRKKDVDSKLLAYFSGTMILAVGIFFIILFVSGLYNYLTKS